MKNLGNLMKQAQQMQAKVEQMQTELAEMEVEGNAGAGMVCAVMTGKGELKRLKIDPSLVDASEVEVLEDLIVAACADAKAKSESHAAAEMSKITGDLPLPPGMKLF